ncbi:serine O-acetyltransferase [Bacillus sp. B1-b2]|uniref:serine O-acetyltransferase n=1 Tax=Bacillus sp. B1-b2 TaxID=2653201 RepID=UPI0012614591|nr:serine acetyltransferase [Bacillus sp. B1-b2]KAB7671719.1 serine acetyltransferase [Bacillus sp. B1-b2]
MIKELKADLKVNNKKDPLIISLLFTYRFGNWIFYHVKTPLIKQLLTLVYRFLDVIFVRIVNNAQIPASCMLGRGLRLPHGGNGIVIHPKVKIGDNSTIFHQVTIGYKDTPTKSFGPPILGNNVFIGTGAKILGEIRISDNVKIGALSLVLTSIPPNKTAVGVPAKASY